MRRPKPYNKLIKISRGHEPVDPIHQALPQENDKYHSPHTDVTCSSNIKKQVDNFLASEYRAWKNHIVSDGGLTKGIFSCSSDNSNTLLMEYVRHIYKEYAIADPLVNDGAYESRQRLSDLVKVSRESELLKADETWEQKNGRRTSISPSYQVDSSSPVKLV